ncbi:hypothetical protein C9374_008898 [Naegleria lovaniensis]|uniref:Myb-like DNA-binding domain containing protein n=1 Tax=Naegleria lovaniensis TaxID=51637 RepID=A0AA88GKI6_NAELO|nr:uncharacterized protein C9374_008898 [Naegleria lovaniensis]KAG2377813.1 hypothetical protein C9374_008898 [Naegleria lovaniensis]
MNPVPQEHDLSNSQALNGNTTHNTPGTASHSSTSSNAVISNTACTTIPVVGPTFQQQPQQHYSGNVPHPHHFILHHHRPNNGTEEAYQTLVLMQDPNTSGYHNPTTTYVHQAYPYHNYVPTTCHPFTTTMYDPTSNHHIVRYEAYQTPSYHYSTVSPVLSQNAYHSLPSHPQHVTLAHQTPSVYSVPSQATSLPQAAVLGSSVSTIHQHHLSSTPNQLTVVSPLSSSQTKTSPTNSNMMVQNNNTSSMSNSPECSSPLEVATSPSSGRDMLSDHETLSPISPFSSTKEPSLLERIHSSSPARKRSNSHSSVNGKGTNISKVKKKRSCARWTEEENKKLFEAYIKYDGKNWSSIAKAVGNKTSDQCNQHWWRVLNPEICKQPWSADEDQRLLDRVQEVGESSWKKVSQGLKGRTDLQCRHRYNQLKKNKKSASESTREESVLNSASNQTLIDDEQRSITAETVVQQGTGYPEFYFQTAPTSVQYQHAPIEYRETVVAEGEVPPQLLVHQYQPQPIQHLQPITQHVQPIQTIQTIQPIQPLPVQSLHAIPVQTVQPIHAVHAVQPIVPPTHTNIYHHYIPVYQQPVNPPPPTFYQEVSATPEVQQEDEFFEPLPGQSSLDESTTELDVVFTPDSRPEKDAKDYVAEIFDHEQRDNAFD